MCFSASRIAFVVSIGWIGTRSTHKRWSRGLARRGHIGLWREERIEKWVKKFWSSPLNNRTDRQQNDCVNAKSHGG